MDDLSIKILDVEPYSLTLQESGPNLTLDVGSLSLLFDEPVTALSWNQFNYTLTFDEDD